MAIGRIGAVLVIGLVIFGTVLAENAVQPVKSESPKLDEGRQVIANNNLRWWPWGWGWGWGWGIAVFVLAIVKGSILLGLFIIWAFFQGFARKKGGCAPIIIRESPPPFAFHDHHPWDRSGVDSSYPRTKREVDYTDSPLYWTDMITDVAFSFLGVNSKDCRKRFVCEIEVRSRRDPFLQMGMQVFGREIFHKYRSDDDKVANSIGECEEIYGKCNVAGPSIAFNVITAQIDPLQDYDDTVEAQGNEESLEEDSSAGEATTEIVTTTSTEEPHKKYFNKRKRIFKYVNKK